MSDITLFRINSGQATELSGAASTLEKALQTLIEKNLETLLGVRFLATEYSTGKTHAGRIDTLGLDEDNCPVILEYKRKSSETVLTQGLFYLDWLMDHRAEFEQLVHNKFGKQVADDIDWGEPRLICVAADFSNYDEHAVQQINRNIDLIRYRQFGDDLLLFELVNQIGAKPSSSQKAATNTNGWSSPPIDGGTKSTETAADWFDDCDPSVRKYFDALENYTMSLGDDVQRKDLKVYIAFKRIRNFVTMFPNKSSLSVYLRLNPEHCEKIDGFTRDVRTVNHWGTGDLELTIKSADDVERAKAFIQMAYSGGSNVT
jgi:predicted transport protein